MTKFLRHIARIIFAFSLCTGCNDNWTINHQDNTSAVKSEGRRNGDFKGIDTIDEIIKTRILLGEATLGGFSLTILTPSTIELRELLGQYSGQGSQNGFKNGVPNALNMLLWNELITKLGESIGKSCQDAGGPQGFAYFKFNPTFQTAIVDICKWPAAEAKTEDVLLNFWLANVQFDAPRSEFEAFRDFFLDPNSPYANEGNSAAVAAMVKAALLNPYFLLEH